MDRNHLLALAAPSRTRYNRSIMNVLVVDDSRIMRNIVKNALRHHPKFTDVDCFEAGDGAEALRLIEAHRMDLVLLDWNMPLMNGIELVKKLREKREHSQIPIIMITSESAKYSVIEAVKAGVNDYLVKPVSDEALIEKLDRLRL
jgi:two-component system chemotaxis response regulator CheY